MARKKTDVDIDEWIEKTLNEIKKMKKEREKTFLETLFGKILGYLMILVIFLFFLWLAKLLIVALF